MYIRDNKLKYNLMIFKKLEYNEMCIDIFPFQLAHDLPSILNTTH